jgi:hypothetical protein
MGIGKLGDSNVVIKRKFRWTLEINTTDGTIPEHYVKTASRPQLDIDEVQIEFLNSVSWIPGRGKWGQIDVTYIDVAHKDMKPLYDWILSIYNFNSLDQSEKEGWSATAILKMYDGCGTTIETWTLFSVFPTNINFGDLSYDDSSEMNISLSLRYSEANLELNCPEIDLLPSCEGCQY